METLILTFAINWATKPENVSYLRSSRVNQPFELSDSHFPNLYNLRIGSRCSLGLLSALNAVIILNSAQNKEEAVFTGKLHWGVFSGFTKCRGKSKMW